MELFARFCNLNERESRDIITQVSDSFAAFPALEKEFDLTEELSWMVNSNMRKHLFL